MFKKSLVAILIFAVIFFVFFLKFYPTGVKISKLVSGVVFHKDDIIKQTNGHTNILILGIGGGTHDGPDLTDTMIFASIDRTNKKIELVSLPRDLWIPDVHEKVNAIYANAETNKKGSGLAIAEAAVSKIMGQPIHYGFRIDFGGFVKAVDELGGLDISVDNTFDDYAYPITGNEDQSCGHTDAEIQAYTASPSANQTDLIFFPCRFKHIHYDAGLQHMDGETALEFVRSRHALGVEGTDFARSKRQAKVIAAFKQKLFSTDTFLHPDKLLSLFGILKDSIDTDIRNEEIIAFLDQIQTYKSYPIQSAVIDTGGSDHVGLLVNPPMSDYGGAWVIVPRGGVTNYSEIQAYLACELQYPTCIVPNILGDPIATVSAGLK